MGFGAILQRLKGGDKNANKVQAITTAEPEVIQVVPKEFDAGAPQQAEKTHSNSGERGQTSVSRPSVAAMTAGLVKGGLGIVGRFSARGDRRTVVDQTTMGRLRLLRDCLRSRKIKIDDFELFPTVGTGAFGRVRMVRLKEHVITNGQLRGDRTVLALKMLNKLKAAQNMGGIGPAMAAMRQEVSIMAHLEFPFVVNMITMFHDDKRVMLLMEFVNAGELFKLIYKDVDTYLSTEIAQHFSAELLLTIEDLHNKNIMYRDLKPENVLIDNKGHAKLVDFGLAKQCDETGKTSTNCGTLVYQAPEILLNRVYGFGVDWWAFGVMFFELLTRRAPWGDLADPFQISQAIMSLNVKYPRKMDKNGKQIVKKFLLHDEKARWGCNAKYPSAVIKTHKFFNGINWNDLVNLKTASPFLPTVKDENDISQLGKYPESLENSGPELGSKDKKLWEQAFENIWD